MTTICNSDDVMMTSPQETLDSLLELYSSLCEEDLWSGLWMQRCSFPETAVAVALESQGLFEQAQETYERVREGVRVWRCERLDV